MRDWKRRMNRDQRSRLVGRLPELAAAVIVLTLVPTPSAWAQG